MTKKSVDVVRRSIRRVTLNVERLEGRVALSGIMEAAQAPAPPAPWDANIQPEWIDTAAWLAWAAQGVPPVAGMPANVPQLPMPAVPFPAFPALAWPLADAQAPPVNAQCAFQVEACDVLVNQNSIFV